MLLTSYLVPDFPWNFNGKPFRIYNNNPQNKPTHLYRLKLHKHLPTIIDYAYLLCGHQANNLWNTTNYLPSHLIIGNTYTNFSNIFDSPRLCFPGSPQLLQQITKYNQFLWWTSTKQFTKTTSRLNFALSTQKKVSRHFQHLSSSFCLLLFDPKITPQHCCSKLYLVYAYHLQLCLISGRSLPRFVSARPIKVDQFSGWVLSSVSRSFPLYRGRFRCC